MGVTVKEYDLINMHFISLNPLIGAVVNVVSHTHTRKLHHHSITFLLFDYIVEQKFIATAQSTTRLGGFTYGTQACSIHIHSTDI